MGVIFEISGREAIPVRALPFVTGWSMSPDMVASALARSDPEEMLRGVVAYHLVGQAKPAPMLPKAWDGVEAELRTLSETLKFKEVVDFESYPTWRYEAILLLPAGVFVWKDKFIAAFEKDFSDERKGILDERPGDRQLSLLPLIPTELREAVVEGFPTNEVPAVQAHGQHPNGSFQPLIGSLAGYWETTFDELPEDRKPFAQELTPLGWDGLSSEQRQSAATQIDWQRDPRCEPALYWELTVYLAELVQQESDARRQANHGVALALIDVQKRINKILNADRTRVGVEIQSLREKQSEAIIDLDHTPLVAASKKERPIGKRERETLLTIIAAMAVKGLKFNIESPGKTAICIEGWTGELGAPVSKRAIEDHLKRIPDALEIRMK